MSSLFPLYEDNYLYSTLLWTGWSTQIPAGAWPGLLIPYSGSASFARDSGNLIVGTGSSDPEVYEYLIDTSGATLSSTDLEL